MNETPEQTWICGGCGTLILPHSVCRTCTPELASESAERTLRSLAMMLGWENMPPRETLEAEIRALKARASLAGPSPDLREQIEALRDALMLQRNTSTDYIAEPDPACWCGYNSGFNVWHDADCLAAKKAVANVLALLTAAPASQEKPNDLAYRIARRIVSSTSGTQTIDAIAESLMAFPEMSATVKLLAAPHAEEGTT